MLVGIIFILITSGLSGCIGQAEGIHAIKLYQEVSNFVNMTKKQMQNFPHLKESILKNKTVEVTPHSIEFSELRGILEYFDADFIYYQNEYYEIQLYYAD